METDLRKSSESARLELRKRAIRMHQSGMKNREIVEALGINKNTMTNWLNAYREKGVKGYQESKRGRKVGDGRLLNESQEKQIQKWITDKCPDQYKLPFALWTRKAIQELIFKQYEIKIAIRTIGDYLKKWGFTPQKPKLRAYEQSDKAVQKWLKEEYPKIKKRAKEEGAQIQWADETGVKNSNNHGRSYAPKGRTPTRTKVAKRFSTNMISSITNQGQVKFMVYSGTMTSQLFIKFMKRTIKSSSQKVFMIVDNLRVHHSKLVKNWLANEDGIELFYLPSYSPELNPDEYLNCDLKYAMSENPAPRNQPQLKKNIISHMRKLQKSPDRVKSYFQNENIKYAS